VTAPPVRPLTVPVAGAAAGAAGAAGAMLAPPVMRANSEAGSAEVGTATSVTPQGMPLTISVLSGLSPQGQMRVVLVAE